MGSMKDKFISDLIDELNEVNEERVLNDKYPLDISFIISVLDQQLEECKEFMRILENENWLINGYEYDEEDYYTNGKIRIIIEKPDEEKESELLIDAYENYCYYLEFLTDQRHWGYCFCDENTDGYNPKYNCCGIGCDWTAPAFRITKEIDMHYAAWRGYEKDYWEYKERFEQSEKNKNEEVEKYKKEQEKECILNSIRELQDKLAKLENQEKGEIV